METKVFSIEDAISQNFTESNFAEEQSNDNSQNIEQSTAQTDEENSNLESSTDKEQTPKIEEKDVLEFLKSKGKEVSSIDELIKENFNKEEEVISNDYEELLTPEDKTYLNFRKQTGGSREQFQMINRDWDKESPIEIARMKIFEESGIKASDDDIIDFIEEELNVDISNDELSLRDKIKLNTYLKPFIDAKKSELEKYRNPSENDTHVHEQSKNNNDNEIVTLENGVKVTRTQYDQMIEESNLYKTKNKEAVNSVTDFNFNISIKGETGEERTLNYKYEVSDEDKRSALSITEDPSSFVNKTYLTPDGFNHKQFNEDMFWVKSENRQKAISALLHQARAEAIEEFLKKRGNVNFQNPNSHTQPNQEGVVIKSMEDLINNY